MTSSVHRSDVIVTFSGGAVVTRVKHVVKAIEKQQIDRCGPRMSCGNLTAPTNEECAMRLRTRGTVLGAIVIGSMLLSSCGPEAPPAQSPTPSVSATPPPQSPTPTESDSQREEREAFEGARGRLPNLHRRVLTRHSASDRPKVTALMRENANGPYLKCVCDISSSREERLAFGRQAHLSRVGRPCGFGPAGRVLLRVCRMRSQVEDYRYDNGRAASNGRDSITRRLRLSSARASWKVRGRQQSARRSKSCVR